MNRRQFTQSLAALFAAPALPVKAMVPAAQPAVSSLAICWADYLTKLHKVCTPEMLRPFLKVDAATAKAIHARLVAQNILTPSGTAHPEIVRNRAPLPKTQPQSAQTTAPNKEKPMLETTHSPRQAQPEDVEQLAQIWHTSWHLAHAAHVPPALTDLRTHDSFTTRLTDMLDDTYTIGPIGSPIGFYSLRGDELYQIFVDPDYHGTGIANTLLKDAETRLLEQGTKTAHLDCIPENTRALAFYARNGWGNGVEQDVSVDTHDGPFTLTCVTLTKTL